MDHLCVREWATASDENIFYDKLHIALLSGVLGVRASQNGVDVLICNAWIIGHDEG